MPREERAGEVDGARIVDMRSNEVVVSRLGTGGDAIRDLRWTGHETFHYDQVSFHASHD